MAKPSTTHVATKIKKIGAPSSHVGIKRKEEIRFEIGQSSFGSILIAFSEMGIVSLLLRTHSDRLIPDIHKQFPQAHLVHGNPHDKKLLKHVIDLIEFPRSRHDLPLDIRGTVFQQRVWRAVQKIPLGHTSTYTDIAHMIGAPRSVRAVGSSCSHNFFAFLIPCHRVLHKKRLTFGGSRESHARQRDLLMHEAEAAKQDPS